MRVAQDGWISFIAPREVAVMVCRPPSGRLACPREATAAAASWQPWLASVLPHSFPGRALLGMRMAAECTPGRRESAKEREGVHEMGDC